MNNKYKQVEAMLYNYKQDKATIVNIDYAIKEVELNYSGCGSIDYSAERSGPTNKVSSSVENEVIKKEKEISKLNRQKRTLEYKVARVDNALQALEEREYKIIQERYFCNKSNKEIALNMFVTEQYFCEVKKRIINKLIDILLP